MTTRGILKALAFAAALAAGATLAPAAGADPLRVCADPDNLPFSKSDGPEHGMYVELAELVAQRLNRPIEYVWWYTQNQRRALRNTILQNGCDAVFALPADADYKVRGLQRSQPFLQVGYAVVAQPALQFASLDDLKAQRIAVQYGSTPQILLASQGGFSTTTYRSSEEALDALARGEVDAAFLWGPVAGYDNKKRFSSRWRVTPVAGHDLSGHVAVAVRSSKDELARAIDAALAALKPEIAALADKYGFPRQTPVVLARARQFAPTSPHVPATFVATVSDTTKPAPAKPTRQRGAASAPTSTAPVAATATAAPALSEAAAAGREQFNSRCSHCHGSDGFSPVRERDVRFLKLRYGDKWQETALATIRKGRPDAGMPMWENLLKDADLQQIVGFLGSIQK